MEKAKKPLKKTALTESQKDQLKVDKLVSSISNSPYPTEAVNRLVKASNYEWYVANKQWKKEYNAKYYQQNKDYWKRRYEKLKGAALDYADTFGTDAYMRAIGKGSLFSDPLLRTAPNTTISFANKVAAPGSQRQQEAEYITTGNRVISEFLIAERNYKRAIDEENKYYGFMKTQNKLNNMTASELHKAGMASVVKAGKDFISNWKSGLKSLFG